MSHWVNKYLVKNWSEDYDCFAHFVEVQEKEFGITDIMTMEHLPEVLNYGDALKFAQTNKQITDKWERVKVLQNGDAVVFGIGPIMFHIGTYVDIDGGGILHCDKGQGVTFNRMSVMKRMGAKISLKLRYKR